MRFELTTKILFGVMVHQERFEDACDEYDRVLRLLTTMVKRLEAK